LAAVKEPYSAIRSTGIVRWTLFEAQGGTVCESNLFGVITTDDGIEIRFNE